MKTSCDVKNIQTYSLLRRPKINWVLIDLFNLEETVGSTPFP
jgi:hypothetical protein